MIWLNLIKIKIKLLSRKYLNKRLSTINRLEFFLNKKTSWCNLIQSGGKGVSVLVTGFSIIFSNRIEKSIYKRSQGDLNPCAALHGSMDFESAALPLCQRSISDNDILLAYVFTLVNNFFNFLQIILNYWNFFNTYYLHSKEKTHGIIFAYIACFYLFNHRCYGQ